jgi:gluconate 2-dehydrogenase gamma chain
MVGRAMERRRFLTVLGASGGGAVAAACGLPQHAVTPATPHPATPQRVDLPPRAAAEAPSSEAIPEPSLTLNADEQAFVRAAVDVLIPQDELGPSASAAGVDVFIDRQLAGAFGQGARLYRSGPFVEGKPEHGYQLPLTPRELFQAGVLSTDAHVRTHFGAAFDGLGDDDRAHVLQSLERGELAGPLGQAFFELLLTLTMEGYFADPAYGGNRDAAGWKLVGFPGLPAIYATEIARYRDKPYDRAPQSMKDFV